MPRFSGWRAGVGVGVRVAQRRGAPPRGSAEVDDRHGAAVTAGAIEEAPGRGVRPNRRHHFEKAGGDRQQRVDEAVLGDPGIAIADIEAQDRPNVGDDRLELARDQADLPQPQVIGHFGSMPYQSTREYRYTLPRLREKVNGPPRPFSVGNGWARRRPR